MRSETTSIPGAIQLRFDKGTLLLSGMDASTAKSLSSGLELEWDERTLNWRMPAYRYRDLVLTLIDKKISYEDLTDKYQQISFVIQTPIQPRAHQEEALNAWVNGGKRGVVSLPTGAGKTILSLFVLEKTCRSTLVVVPTLDLMQQWIEVFRKHASHDVGILGGGQHVIKDITVATYDSASIYAEHLGNKFGLLVFDECHHLPAPHYQLIARASLAPFRLGLSATVERADNKEELIYELLGPKVYQAGIHDMQHSVLSPYTVIKMQIPLNPEEWDFYQKERLLYKQFLERNRVSMASADGWQRFVMLSARSTEGRRAMIAYRNFRRTAQQAAGKLSELWNIFKRHNGERIIVFTDENSFAYTIGRKFLVPVLTHHTKIKERMDLLKAFREGELPILVTSKVLNEGVDVPEASIAVVMSGSGAVREHVQRLGRILRHRPGKQAVLYELVAQGTNELFVSERRRQHHAYQRSSSV